jgi:hypothetical protein
MQLIRWSPSTLATETLYSEFRVWSLGWSEMTDTSSTPWGMDGKWTENSFSLGFTSLANLSYQFFLLPTLITISFFTYILVWTPCLMHRCVCIWRYILQNYNYKLHFQNLSIYHIPHVSIGTLAAENLDVCTACDPWDSNIQLTMGKDQRQQIYVGFVADIDIKIFGGAPPGAGHAFPTQQHMRRGGRGFIYFCQGFLPYMMPSMDGWRDEWMDEKLHEKRPQRPLLYVIKHLHPYTCVCNHLLSVLPTYLPTYLFQDKYQGETWVVPWTRLHPCLHLRLNYGWRLEVWNPIAKVYSI